MTSALLAALVIAQASPPDLSIWRKPDSKGRACFSCHSPDGIELAAFRYSDEDVLRRASKHLEEGDRNRILTMLLTKRATLGAVTQDPMSDRPLQPGGSAVAGDAGFAAELRSCLPHLFGSPISTLADAKRARDEVLGVDLRALKVGFEFSRLSEDGFHGTENATMAQWIPDTGLEMPTEVISAQDRYLAEPSVKNLTAIDEAVVKANPVRSPIGLFSLNKYRALLILQHRLRVEAGLASEPLIHPLGREARANPFWLVADSARVYGSMGAVGLALPEDIAAAKSQNLDQQLKELRAPWYWMGWMEDPTLSRSGSFPETQTGQYFVQTLLEDGPYPVHALFAVTRRMVQLGSDRAAWTSFSPQHFEVQYSAFAVTAMLKSTQRTSAFDTLLANSFRMALYLLIEDLERTKRSLRPESQSGQIRFLLAEAHGLTKVDRALAAHALDLLRKSTREASR